uniref:trace amine-associated receptor 13c-like n=1 Tax=Monopterus albus TaxID=43700 RepID=UPI0009B40DA8|nr:trace amine-associated receptor 13c-like [Monopterus albus]
MDDTWGSELCFPNLNSSCRRLLRPRSETLLLYILVASVSLLTVTLNLLIIISISHFRQLHTPTNTLLQSMAVCDMGLGLLVMPVEGLRYIERCWLLGRIMCAVSPYLFYSLVSTSLGHMVLISIDRYLTICDPLIYSSKVTVTNVKICICLCWTCSITYNVLLLIDHLVQPDRFSSCHGECVVVISQISGTVDMFMTFIGPCTVMVVLYIRVFVAALSQMRVIQSQAAVTKARAAPPARKSPPKAARTLGILIVVYLMCYCPFFYPALSGVNSSSSLSYYPILAWIMILNSCLNPLIYAMFYPWFRKAIKLIITLRILQDNSPEVKIL